MVAVPVEQLKREYTDKYVKVDASRPELARFRDVVGQVKTVNMSGRALVEFLDYHLNIGWYDIDLTCLTVVDKPTEADRAAAKAGHDKPAGKAAPTTGDKQTADAAKPAVAGTKAGGSKMSVGDMLAAARGGGGSAKPATPAAPKAKAAAPAKPAAKPAGGKMSVADMLAAARGGATAAAAAADAPAAETTAAEASAPPADPAEPAPKPAAKAPAGGKVDRSSMSVADMIAYCREHDAS